MNEENVKLSDSAKRAIRLYMWKSIALPALPLSILLFGSGFLWNEIIQKTAQINAESRYFDRLQQLTDRAHESTNQLELTKLSVEVTADELDTIAKSANEDRTQVSNIKSEIDAIFTSSKEIESQMIERGELLKSDDTIEKIADSLRQDSAFTQSVLSVANNKNAAIEDRIKSNESLLSYGDQSGIKGSKEITFSISRPGLLFAVFEVQNNEGNSVGGGQHTIYASANVQINGVACASDYSGYYVWDGRATANASCISPVLAGDIKLLVQASGNHAPTTSGKLRYAVLPFVE